MRVSLYEDDALTMFAHEWNGDGPYAEIEKHLYLNYLMIKAQWEKVQEDLHGLGQRWPQDDEK